MTTTIFLFTLLINGKKKKINLHFHLEKNKFLFWSYKYIDTIHMYIGQ